MRTWTECGTFFGTARRLPSRLAVMAARPALLSALILALPPARNAKAELPAPLPTDCAPPVVPTCVDGPKGHPELVRDCAASVFACHVCLTRETERAVREANGAMGKVRCAQGRKAC